MPGGGNKTVNHTVTFSNTAGSGITRSFFRLRRLASSVPPHPPVFASSWGLSLSAHQSAGTAFAPLIFHRTATDMAEKSNRTPGDGVEIDIVPAALIASR